VVELLCPRADLVIATVLVPGSTAPKLITAQTVKAVKTGAMASFETIEEPIHS
jgi:alanine dehydrogenase